MEELAKDNNPKELIPDKSGPLKDSIFSTIFNSNQSIMLLADLENNKQILDANEAAQKFYGYTREQFLTMNMEHINTLSEEERRRRRVGTNRKAYSSFNIIHKTSTGLLKNVEVNVSPIIYENKKAMFIIIHDITERKDVELKLAESEQKYRSYFENSPLSLWEEDYSDAVAYLNNLPVNNEEDIRKYLYTHPDEIKKCSELVKILDVNLATLKMYDALSKEDLFWNLEKVFSFNTYKSFADSLISIYNNEPVFSTETDNCTISGRILNIKLEIAILSGYRILVTISDITDQKKIEKDLREGEDKYRSYFESSPLSLLEEDYSAAIGYLHSLPVADEEELRIYLNKHSEIVRKCLSLVEILNANQSTLDLYDIETKSDNLEGFTKKFTQSSYAAYQEELISLYMNKSLITLQFQDQTVKGKIIDVKLEMKHLSENRYLITIVDLSKLKSKELELEELLNQTRADTETKEILLREINHRVKNNLSSFIGMLYAEKRQSGRELNEAQMEHVDSLINRVKGISIAHDLLSRSQWAPISIFTLSGKIIHSLKHLIPADRIIETRITPSMIFLDADQSHNLAVIVNELFLNSIKHGVGSGEKIEVEIDIKVKKGKITFIYGDNGPGFPKKVLNSELYNVGLYLVKNIVEKSLRGSVSMENKDGAIVTIQFPGGTEFEEL